MVVDAGMGRPSRQGAEEVPGAGGIKGLEQKHSRLQSRFTLVVNTRKGVPPWAPLNGDRSGPERGAPTEGLPYRVRSPLASS